MFEFLIGTLFWGGLLVLVLLWMDRGRRRGRSTGQAWTGQRPAPPSTTGRSASSTPVAPGPRTTPVAAEDRDERVSDALVDGLVIGHFLTRDHFTQRVDELEGEVDDLRSAQRSWADDWADSASDTFDDLDADLDFAEFDAMGGFGVEPWADEMFGPDEDDED
ncbi:MAG: hypothetical protein EA340_07695 [Nitriliruptor sp.]|nr:MAG: hypothetical protein EA340_07695 [Nitriliruptor sp.]